MKYDLVIFDWDGTLVDSIPHIVDSMKCSMEDMKIDIADDDSIKGIIGLGMQEALDTLLPEQSHDASFCIAFRNRYRFHFMEKEVKQPAFFPGSMDLLAELKASDVKLAIATGKSRRGLDYILQRENLLGYFNSSRCADEAKSKPDPEMILQILAELAIPSERAVMVGDSVHDLAMAQQAKVDAVGVTHGVEMRESLDRLGAMTCFDSIKELQKWFFK